MTNFSVIQYHLFYTYILYIYYFLLTAWTKVVSLFLQQKKSILLELDDPDSKNSFSKIIMNVFNGSKRGILSLRPTFDERLAFVTSFVFFIFLAFISQLMTCTDPCESDKTVRSFAWSHEFFPVFMRKKCPGFSHNCVQFHATFHLGEWCSISIQECKQLNLCLGVRCFTYWCWDASHISMYNKLPQRGIQLASCHGNICSSFWTCIFLSPEGLQRIHILQG